MEGTPPPHQFSGISQIRKMSPNPGSGTLSRDPLPRVSRGFTLPLCLHASQTHTSVLCPEVPGKTGATNAGPCLCIWLPPLGSLGPCAGIYRNCSREQRDKDKHTTSVSHSSAKTENLVGSHCEARHRAPPEVRVERGQWAGDIARW